MAICRLQSATAVCTGTQLPMPEGSVGDGSVDPRRSGGGNRSSNTSFDAHNQELLNNAKLIAHPSKDTPEQLNMATDQKTCYLVRNTWHPHESVDGSIEALLAHPRTFILHTEHCTGVTIYKVRFDQ